MKERNANYVYEEETKRTVCISDSFYYNQLKIVAVLLHKKTLSLSLFDV